jgi:carboxypeptidase Q
MEEFSTLMPSRIRRALLLSSLCVLTISSQAADKSKTDTPAWEQPQPAVEKLDLNMYMRIREEGLQHSHVMEYGSALADGIGPRLTGSPNLAKANAWTRDQLTAMGCVNAHLDDWGEFGMGWAAAQHLGADDFAGHGDLQCAGDAVVAGNEWAR